MSLVDNQLLIISRTMNLCLGMTLEYHTSFLQATVGIAPLIAQNHMVVGIAPLIALNPYGSALISPSRELDQVA
jgi:hypothetical protein